MSIKLELIKIVEHPSNRNNWISVEDNPELAIQFESLISYYDFIDFEGDVLYYNQISIQVDGVKTSFFDIYKTGDVIFNQSSFDKLSKLILPNYLNDFEVHFKVKFVEGETVVRII
jgi:hypothetical protein